MNGDVLMLLHCSRKEITNMLIITDHTELKKSARTFAFSLSELVTAFLSLSMYKSGIEVRVLVFD
jgi:hypothetical protein